MRHNRFPFVKSNFVHARWLRRHEHQRLFSVEGELVVGERLTELLDSVTDLPERRARTPCWSDPRWQVRHAGDTDGAAHGPGVAGRDVDDAVPVTRGRDPESHG